MGTGLMLLLFYAVLRLFTDPPRYHRTPFSEIRNRQMGKDTALKKVKNIKAGKR